ncbi:hypothetical protein [Streptomyces nigrescens]|uniref:hypothetical protein n=1 Tax=Streptomyces nigrescens TaxID=1920 RepID=UPI00347316B1
MELADISAKQTRLNAVASASISMTRGKTASLASVRTMKFAALECAFTAAGVTLAPSPHSAAPSSSTTTTLAVIQAVIAVLQFILAAILWRMNHRISQTQISNSSFEVEAIAIREVSKDGTPVKLAVRVGNKGGSPGMIRKIDVQLPSLDGTKARKRKVAYTGWGARSPFPFYLPGRATAEVVIEPEGGKVFGQEDVIVLHYGLAEKTTVRFTKTIQSPYRIDGSTVLPPGSLPVSSPPSAPAE